MHDSQIKSILESLLFVSSEPLTVEQIVGVFSRTEQHSECPTGEKIQVLLQEMKADDQKNQRGIQMVEVAGGYQRTTCLENAEWIKQLQTIKMASMLSRPALETLAIVAYRQPVSTPEVESVRGVDCNGVLKTLLERRLIKIVGRRDTVGKPMIYGTTREFLECFGIRDLTELPPLKEFQEIAQDHPELISASAPQ